MPATASSIKLACISAALKLYTSAAKANGVVVGVNLSFIPSNLIVCCPEGIVIGNTCHLLKVSLGKLV